MDRNPLPAFIVQVLQADGQTDLMNGLRKTFRPDVCGGRLGPGIAHVPVSMTLLPICTHAPLLVGSVDFEPEVRNPSNRGHLYQINVIRWYSVANFIELLIRKK